MGHLPAAARLERRRKVNLLTYPDTHAKRRNYVNVVDPTRQAALRDAIERFFFGYRALPYRPTASSSAEASGGCTTASSTSSGVIPVSV